MRLCKSGLQAGVRTGLWHTGRGPRGGKPLAFPRAPRRRATAAGTSHAADMLNISTVRPLRVVPSLSRPRAGGRCSNKVDTLSPKVCSQPQNETIGGLGDGVSDHHATPGGAAKLNRHHRHWLSTPPPPTRRCRRDRRDHAIRHDLARIVTRSTVPISAVSGHLEEIRPSVSAPNRSTTLPLCNLAKHGRHETGCLWKSRPRSCVPQKL